MGLYDIVLGKQRSSSLSSLWIMLSLLVKDLSETAALLGCVMERQVMEGSISSNRLPGRSALVLLLGLYAFLTLFN